MIRKIIVTLLFCLLISCISMSSNTAVICDTYFVGKLGDSNINWLFYGDKTVGGEGIIAGVDEIGCNSKYIIAKTTSNEYYIIPYTENKLNYFDTQLLKGPLSEYQFNSQKSKISIDGDLEFTQSF